MSSLSDDFINAVPQALRDGAYSLGATQSETIKQVILPAALPGIVGGVLLAVSRAIGETMIVVMAAGLAANLTINPLKTVTTVTVQIVTLLVGDQEFDSPKIHGLAENKAELDNIVETSLKKAGLWDEDSLDRPGTGLSGGQQQRLCIARTIAVSPEVILMDESCSALDPIATAVIEDLIEELREQYSIAIVTHSMQQTSRVSQRTAYFHLGDLIEVGPTDKIFTRPNHQLTEDYITGRFG